MSDFELKVPPKKFTIDTGSWSINQGNATTALSQTCSTTSMCQDAVQLACPTGCTATCNTTCEMTLDVELRQPVDLVAEQPELSSLNSEPVIKVTIDAVTYDVTSNTLNITTPAIDVYVAPMSVLKHTDPQAKQIGTIAPILAGTTPSAQTLTFTATGKATLVDIMSSFKSPFNVLVASSLLVTSGQPLPMGKLEASVLITGHVGL